MGASTTRTGQSALTVGERILGGLLGVAAGDALGATVEFCSPGSIVAKYGRHTEIVGGGMFGWRPGQGTDDTDMTAAVARAYAHGYTLDAVAAQFLAWFDGGPRDIGGMTSRALSQLAAHGDPRASGIVALGPEGPAGNTAGNGSLMRALPTGLARAEAAARRAEAGEISAITHADPRCVEACVAYVEIAAALVDGHTPADAIELVARACVTRADVVDALDVDPASPVTSLPTTGFVLDSLRAAVWAIQQPRSLEEVLVDLVNRGDDADTTGAIAGGLLGVRDGAPAVPERWLATLEYAAEFTGLAEQLTALRTGTSIPA